MANWRFAAIYFAIVMILTVPFWLGSAIVQARMLPGLSVAAFAVVVPAIGAAIVTVATGGRQAVLSLFATLRTSTRGKWLIILAAVAVPLVVSAIARTGSDTGGTTSASSDVILALVPLFFLAAIAEEIGWSAFATQRLARDAGVAVAGLVVGSAWGIWHLPSLLQLGHSAEWIAWWSLWTVSQRIIMAFLYVRGGSWIWGPIIFHAVSNIAWQAAPDMFDPMVEGIAMAAMASAVLVIFPDRAKTRGTGADLTSVSTGRIVRL